MPLIFNPKSNTDGTIVIAANVQTMQDLFATPIQHENTTFEEGYATLAVEHTIVAGDSVSYYAGMFYGGAINEEADFLLEDYNGNTVFNSESDSIILFSLNRQNFWTLHEGIIPRVKKTGTSGQLTVNWRFLYR